jgi:hypothetical protein
MAEAEPAIVTRRGIELPVESVRPPDDAPVDDVRRALVLNRYARVLDILEEATRESDPDVMVAATDRETSLLQSEIAERSEQAETVELPAGGREVKFGNRLEDPWGWATSLFDHVDDSRNHAIQRPTSLEPEPLPDGARVALLSDWGTGMYGAPASAQSIRDRGGFELLMHLGDVYYSGTVKETRDRFLRIWPQDAARRNRALNANHEMYSGGYGYFDHTLPQFRQQSSYFGMATSRWLLIGLDTGYVDHDLDREQAGWVNRVVAEHGAGRRVLLFSHHQLFSRLGSQGPKLGQALDGLLRSKSVAAWYWGHEHDCALYDAHPVYGLLGRLLGHGGIPAFRKDEVREAPEDSSTSGITWRRLPANDKSPGAVYLDGPNRYIKGKEQKFSPHGYLTLDLGSERLVERVHLPDGTEIRRTEIA